ncbi:MAG: glycogen debranching protein GlgX [Gemmataceae bacterium]
MHTIKTSRGHSLPLGASPQGQGVNFALLCRHGTNVQLVIYPVEDSTPLAEIDLDHFLHRTGDHWHIHVHGLPDVFRYGWRVDGPKTQFHRFDKRLVLIDPAARAISDGEVWGVEPDNGVGLDNAVESGHQKTVDSVPPPRGTLRRSLYVEQEFDWQEDVPPLVPLEDSIIYELHVRGFTCHPKSGVAEAEAGTFRGLIEKIPYLKELGITAVELLPIHEFDENDCPFTNPRTGQPLRNFWGYNSINFSSPKASYAASANSHNQIAEFQEMVKAFHDAGIEVILDVVFNHTGEGDQRGRTYSFRGLDNQLYYMLGPNGEYFNYSGCGNTVNCNHPIIRNLILTCLRYWVAEMHVDGLRFDLAAILGRDSQGHVLPEPPVVEMIVEDGVLADTKLIAEPWDAGGLYQLGFFPFGKRWSEWNGKFRDDVRRFWRGDLGMTSALATRLCGSADLYEPADRLPKNSINFITCHDGFTLYDLVSYNHKHNEANGEGNRDGESHNNSWNCGIEGATNNPQILRLRRRQAKNLMATLLLAQGVPMLLAGDEFLRTQKGNNNAWCQDNEVSWVDWSLLESNSDFFRFIKMLIAFRKNHPALRRRKFFRGVGPKGNLKPDITWHGVTPFQPDFSYSSRTLALTIDGGEVGGTPPRRSEKGNGDETPGSPVTSADRNDQDFYIAFNAWRQPVPFRIPRSPSGRLWRRVVDTSLESPKDIVEFEDAIPFEWDRRYMVGGRSLIVLISEK